MPSLKDLKNRIGSVKNTRKITKAMQMVAAAKLRRAQEAAEAARPYADRMAAVMAGGMVPPLAIALCTTFFKNRFTESERKAGITNYVMGLSFITEGAIPFAAGDPLRVIPSVFIGSATAGALSMAFDCTLRAPHGGIFVVPTIGNPAMYLVAILVGAVVGCAILSVLKKPIKE